MEVVPIHIYVEQGSVHDEDQTVLTAQKAVQILEDCSGDLDLFCNYFHCENEHQKAVILVKLQQIFEDEKAALSFAKWKKLLHHFNQAKWLLFQRAAISQLENIDLAKSSKDKLNMGLAFAKFALADTFEMKRASARKEGNQNHEKSIDDIELEEAINKISKKLDAHQKTASSPR